VKGEENEVMENEMYLFGTPPYHQDNGDENSE
jgi:hypothetical protein